MSNSVPALYGREGPSQQMPDVQTDMDFTEPPWPQVLLLTRI